MRKAAARFALLARLVAVVAVAGWAVADGGGGGGFSATQAEPVEDARNCTASFAALSFARDETPQRRPALGVCPHYTEIGE